MQDSVCYELSSVPRVRIARLAKTCVGQRKARAQQVNLPGANSIYQVGVVRGDCMTMPVE